MVRGDWEENERAGCLLEGEEGLAEVNRLFEFGPDMEAPRPADERSGESLVTMAEIEARRGREDLIDMMDNIGQSDPGLAIRLCCYRRIFRCRSQVIAMFVPVLWYVGNKLQSRSTLLRISRLEFRGR